MLFPGMGAFGGTPVGAGMIASPLWWTGFLGVPLLVPWLRARRGAQV
jgi:hypothetical protein